MLCLRSPEIHGGGECGIILSLPETLPGYASKKLEPDAVEKKLLPEDTGFAKAVYFTPTSDESRRDKIFCEIVLSGRERRSIHRPEVCLQGQGWTILESTTRALSMGTGRELRVRDLFIERNVRLAGGALKPQRAHYFYWFVGSDVTTSSHAERIWLTLWDNISRRVNHRWAYVTVLATSAENFAVADLHERPRSSGETVALLEQFIRDLAPRFQKSFMDNLPVAAAN